MDENLYAYLIQSNKFVVSYKEKVALFSLFLAMSQKTGYYSKQPKCDRMFCARCN